MSPDHDEDVSRMLSDAVSDVDPDPALDRIRRRTGGTRRTDGARSPRPWLAITAAAAGVAVIVGGIALLNRPDPTTPSAGPISASSRPSGAPTADSPSPSASPAGPGPVVRAVAAYFVGDTPQGPRLFREFQSLSVPPDDAPVLPAVQLALGHAQDPDYRTAWPTGTQVDQDSVSPSGDVSVSLTNSAADLATRPEGMSTAEARAAVQQVVYTVQAAVKNRNPVRIQLDGKDTSTLLGVDVSEPVAQGSELDVLALVSISDPTEGAVVRGSFVARGVASSFEANVPWKLTRDGKVVKSGYSTAAGYLDKLYPWKTPPIDVSGLPPGSYTFVASTDDPSAGEGAGPMVDTRTIRVRR